MERGDDRHGGRLIGLSIRADLKPLHRALIDVQVRQVPFATAVALTNLAKGAQALEADDIAHTFDHPTPFTRNAIAIQPATKSKPIAVVFPKAIAAEYLEPYIDGGNRSLGSKKGMLVPIGARTNQYGNLSKGQLARLKAKPGVFIGAVTTKGGRTIKGVWQRPAAPKRPRGAGQPPPAGHLKLLIEFADTTPVRKRLDFYGRIQRYVRANAAREFNAALSKALATARR